MSHQALKPTAEGNGPRHVAIIMDGNRRWASARGMPPFVGHRKGADAVHRCVESAIQSGIPNLTLFAFSSENWRRPDDEIAELMELLRVYLKKELKELMKNGVRLSFIGRREGLAADILELIDRAEAETKANVRLRLTLALNYGGRLEIADAAREIARRVEAGELSAEQIDEDMLERSLYTHDLPDPDLLIRTGGEQRISNFLLWQMAYTELVFLPIRWPEFADKHFQKALAEFEQRDRRYGACSA